MPGGIRSHSADPQNGLIWLSPILAALAMSFSSVTVISNANRLKRFKLTEVAA